MYLITALLLLALALPGAVLGAEAPDEPAAADERDETPDDAATNTAEDPILAEAAEAETTDRRSGADDTFVPSVRISEDLSVSFPADI